VRASFGGARRVRQLHESDASVHKLSMVSSRTAAIMRGPAPEIQAHHQSATKERWCGKRGRWLEERWPMPEKTKQSDLACRSRFAAKVSSKVPRLKGLELRLAEHHEGLVTGEFDGGWRASFDRFLISIRCHGVRRNHAMGPWSRHGG